MELHNLKPAEGSIKKEKELVEEKDPREEELLPEDTKAQNRVQDTLKKVVLKAANNLCKEGCLSLDLQVLTEKII